MLALLVAFACMSASITMHSGPLALVGSAAPSPAEAAPAPATGDPLDDILQNPNLPVILGIGVAVVLVVAIAVVIASTSRRLPPFGWTVLHEECLSEFTIDGPRRSRVEKREDYKMLGWVIPVNGTLELHPGQVHRWALVMEKMNKDRPEIQFGFQGVGFEHPWRLITTTRCSRSKDEEEQWESRPGGDRRIDEGDKVHLELDLSKSPGVLSMAINDSPFEVVFADIPIQKAVLPAVMLGGHGACVRVEATRRASRGRS